MYTLITCWRLQYDRNLAPLTLMYVNMLSSLLLLSLVGMAMPQRSPYLPSAPQDYPGLLPKYRPSTTPPPPGSAGLGDRFGGPSQIPPGAILFDGTLYDKETVDRVAQWPKDKQPFWYVNRQQIASHTGQQRPASANTTGRRTTSR